MWFKFSAYTAPRRFQNSLICKFRCIFNKIRKESILIMCHLFSITEGLQKRLQEEKDPEQRDLIEKQYVL